MTMLSDNILLSLYLFHNYGQQIHEHSYTGTPRLCPDSFRHSDSWYGYMLQLKDNCFPLVLEITYTFCMWNKSLI